MSELINAQQVRNVFRWRLLTTVSSLALFASVCGAQNANAEDADRPAIWIELGADLDRVNSGQQAFSPAFIANNPNSTAFDPVSPAEAQKPPGSSFSNEANLSFQPKDSNWIFSASVRYGRSSAKRDVHQTAKNGPQYRHLVFIGPHHSKYRVINPPETYTPTVANFLGAQEAQSESHAVIDFQAGKDVGLGLFGRGGTSVLSAGVRFAQFTSRMQSNLQARPDLNFYTLHFPSSHRTALLGTVHQHNYHQYVATARSARSFHGIGPSFSWNVSAPVAGNTENGELAVDWGVNASVLFGRQKANVQHHTSAVYFATVYGVHPNSGDVGYNHPQVNLQRSHSMVVPNLGGFAGFSLRTENFKIAFGYRSDFFFGAMDTGFDTAKRSTIGFYGPFASVSVGLGG